MDKKQALIKEFEDMKEQAEMRVLSKYSLENPLSDKEYQRFKELTDKYLR